MPDQPVSATRPSSNPEAFRRSDPIRSELGHLGIRSFDYHLEAIPGRPHAGTGFRIGSSELVYRGPEKGILLIVLYRKREPLSSLRNPLAELIWFLLLATRPEYGVQRVMCHIATEARTGGGLSTARFKRLCQKFFRAGVTRYEGSDWLYADVEPLRTRLHAIRHQAAKPGPSGNCPTEERNRSGAVGCPRPSLAEAAGTF